MSPAFNYYLWERPLTCVIGLVSKIAFPFYFLLRSLLDAGEKRVGPFFDRVCSEGTEKACKLHPPGLLFPKSRFYNVGKPSDRNREDWTASRASLLFLERLHLWEQYSCFHFLKNREPPDWYGGHPHPTTFSPVCFFIPGTASNINTTENPPRLRGSWPCFQEGATWT